MWERKIQLKIRENKKSISKTCIAASNHTYGLPHIRAELQVNVVTTSAEASERGGDLEEKRYRLKEKKCAGRERKRTWNKIGREGGEPTKERGPKWSISETQNADFSSLTVEWIKFRA